MKIASKEFVVTKMTELMITPKKHFSQNFLTDFEVVNDAIDALESNENEQVIEIGPGLGALTQELLDRNYKVDAYEIDEDMVNHLKTYFQKYSSFSLHNIYFLKVDLSKYEGKRIKFISNVPYNITTPLIEKIVTSSLDIGCFEFMVQKEVYDRIKAKVGSKDYAPLNIFIEYVGKLSVVRKVSYKCFIPMPNVDSIILKIDFSKQISKDTKFNKLFVEVTKACFLLRRKTILNNLTSYFKKKEKALDILTKANINVMTRPEQMSLGDYLNLTNIIYQNK